MSFLLICCLEGSRKFREEMINKLHEVVLFTLCLGLVLGDIEDIHFYSHYILSLSHRHRKTSHHNN